MKLAGPHWLGATLAERIFRIALVAFVLLGCWLRIRSYLIVAPSLWLDEAYWAMKTLKRSAFEQQIRPFGFLQVTSWLVQLFGAHAAVFRLLPFMASIASVGAMPYVALRLFDSRWAALLSVFVFATHPVALEMSVEFKHYGVEIAIYVLLLALYLHHRRAKRLWTFGALLLLAWFSFAFSLTVIFLYPALFGVLAWEAFRNRSWRRLAAVGIMACVCIASILVVYFSIWKGISQPRAERKWGRYHDVFYLANAKRNKDVTRAQWTLAKSGEMAALPGIGRLRWESEALSSQTLSRLGTADFVFWCALHLAGLLYLIRYKRKELLWLWTPFLLVLLFSSLGRWPAGAFRTNSFLIPYSVLLASFALEWLAGRRLVARVLAPALVSVAMLPPLIFRPMWSEKGLWSWPGAFPEALAVLHSESFRSQPSRPASRRRQPILLDNGSCKPWQYYLNHDASISQGIGARLRDNFKPVCRRTQASIVRNLKKLGRSQADAGFWIISSDPRKHDGLQQAAKDTCAKLETHVIGERTNLVMRCTGLRSSP